MPQIYPKITNHIKRKLFPVTFFVLYVLYNANGQLMPKQTSIKISNSDRFKFNKYACII